MLWRAWSEDLSPLPQRPAVSMYASVHSSEDRSPMKMEWVDMEEASWRSCSREWMSCDLLWYFRLCSADQKEGEKC